MAGGAFRRAFSHWIAPLAMVAGCLSLAAAWNGGDPPMAPPAEGSTVGLFTSLPVLWRETAELGELLKPDALPHPALAVLSGHGRPAALDSLADGKGNLPLAPGALLVMAQPRPLSPQENVALDRWVRAGGHVLLFADPLLTGHSDFAIGDRRRPQDVALLSPILARWGLVLAFDEAQAAGERVVALDGLDVPVNLPGRFSPQGHGACRIAGEGLFARCRVGKGRVTALADAALFEEAETVDGEAAVDQAGRDRALDWLLAEAGR